MIDSPAATTVTIDPVTRIEGHSKITIHLDDDGRVNDAQFTITQFRGFEAFAVGRPMHEMPSLMARVCGICPVSHLVASAKAVDDIMAVTPPPTGAHLREMINLAQVTQSNALSFFHLSAPDLLLGFDAPQGERNIFGMAAKGSFLATDGIALRRFGQHAIELLGGTRLHPYKIVPGGMESPLSQEHREEIQAGIPEAIASIERALDWYLANVSSWAAESAVFGDFPSAFHALVTPEGNVEHYDGRLRIMDHDGTLLADGIDPKPYWEYLGEANEDFTFLKSVYLKERGYPDGVYRVGPLARINVAERMGTPRADARLEAFRSRVPRPATSSFHYHEARLIDTLYAVERIAELLADDGITAPRVRSTPRSTATRGSASPRHRAGPCCTTTRSTTTGSCSRPT